MAVAGSAIGLGNFLRFPGQAASNGGGGFGHSTAPGIFHILWEKNRFIKYFGLIGIFGPLAIFIYYIYIESWTLAYSFFSVSGRLSNLTGQGEMTAFLSAFQGLTKNEHFQSIGTAYTFFLITFGINMSTIGWTFMIISWVFILTMLIFCFYKVFKAEKRG